MDDDTRDHLFAIDLLLELVLSRDEFREEVEFLADNLHLGQERAPPGSMGHHRHLERILQNALDRRRYGPATP